MFGYFLQLSLQRIFRKRKSSILSFLVLTISFSFMIVVLSIVESISKPNEEYRLNTYGEWSFAILPANGYESSIRGQKQVQEVGEAICCGTLRTSNGDVGIGTVDFNFIQIGRIVLEDGHFPETEEEIAMEADTLSSLGYDYTLGQEIMLRIKVPSDETGQVQFVEKDFTLCGVIREFHSLWGIYGVSEQQVLVSAFISQSAAEAISKETETEPCSQLFLNVSEGDRGSVQDFLRHGLFLYQNVFKNDISYTDMATSNSPDSSFYIFLISAVSLTAVFSVFFLQIKDAYHSHVVCMSIGMTKKQLAFLLVLETLLLVLPAIVFGILLGSVLTDLSLRILLYSGSAPIQVIIPTRPLLVAIISWVLCTILCRLTLFFVTSRAQLTGAFQLDRAKSNRFSRLTKLSTTLLIAMFGAVLFFTWMGSMRPIYLVGYWSSCPSYTISRTENGCVGKTEAAQMKQIPGVSYVDGFGESKISITFPGMEETETWIYSIDENGWEKTFEFGSDREAFHNGDIVLLTFEDGLDHDVLIPDRDVTLRFQMADGSIIEKTTPISIQMLSKTVHNRLLAHIREPYVVICSERFLESVLSKMGPGQKWDIYTAGEEPGYDRVYVGADLNSGYLSTDIAVAKYCRGNGLILDNRRQQFAALQQESLQDLIMLFSSGGCIMAVSLLLLCNLLQLDTVQEKKTFAILRMIGLSRRQLWLRILLQSLGRCFLATLIGALVYLCYAIFCEMRAGLDFMQSWSEIVYGIEYYGNGLPQLILFTAVCFIVPFILTLFTKIQAAKDRRDSE